MKLGHTLSRLLIGGLFVGHGTQKLFGWFGGHGLEGTGQFFESLGLKPGRRNALAAGVSEAAGGALLAVRPLSPLALAALTGTMATAIRKVHAPNGIWSSEGGMEYNLVLVAAAFAIVDEDHGPLWALAALGAGVAGSAAVIELARREAGEAAATQQAPEAAAEQAEVPVGATS